MGGLLTSIVINKIIRMLLIPVGGSLVAFCGVIGFGVAKSLPCDHLHYSIIASLREVTGD
jgi:phosphate/sulfate permease